LFDRLLPNSTRDFAVLQSGWILLSGPEARGARLEAWVAVRQGGRRSV